MFSSPTAFKEDATEATNVAISARQIDSDCKTGDFFFFFSKLLRARLEAALSETPNLSWTSSKIREKRGSRQNKKRITQKANKYVD